LCSTKIFLWIFLKFYFVQNGEKIEKKNKKNRTGFEKKTLDGEIA